MIKKINNQAGFTLIELLVALGIGLFLIAGIFTVYINSSKSQRIVESETRLLDDARFALETISFDLRHAGVYGTLNHEDVGKIDQASIDFFNDVTGQCGGAASGWVTNFNRPVFSADETSPYIADCMADYNSGDILEVRYVTRFTTALDNNTLYMKSDTNNAQVFKGSLPPAAPSAQAKDYLLVAKAYYISDFTNAAGDGVPSLHMVTLQPGPAVIDTVLLQGVENLQIKYGLVAEDDASSTSVVTWEDPTAGIDWKRVVAARVWLVMRSRDSNRDVSTATTLNVGGVDTAYADDGFRRIVVNASIRLRNINTGF